MGTFQLDPSEDWKKSKLEAVRSHHEDLISDLGISKTDFNMKMPFYDKNGKVVVGIFASEFRKEKGFYFELIDRKLDPADPERKVYRVAPSTTFEEEYELNEKGSYLVPIEELRIVNEQAVAISHSAAVTSVDSVTQKTTFKANKTSVQAYKAPATMEDAPYAEMTIRDFYAIHTGKPVSAKNWLNDLIKSTK
jgi:hypothetical protein